MQDLSSVLSKGNMEDPSAKKKRARPSDSADGDDKKRGRPRVEKQDESAADVGLLGSSSSPPTVFVSANWYS